MASDVLLLPAAPSFSFQHSQYDFDLPRTNASDGSPHARITWRAHALTLAHAEDSEIPLSQEIAFIERYLYLQKARFDERLTAILKIEPDTLDALVPTFILQPLVENAIRYGMESCSGQIVVEVFAWRNNGRLHLRVEDNGLGLPSGWDLKRSVGNSISNTRERLQRLYGSREQSFEIAGAPRKGARVDLTFPFRSIQSDNPPEAQPEAYLRAGAASANIP